MPTSTTKLDQQTTKLVKATVPILEELGDEITSRFYQMMFENHPELKNIFNQTNQQKGDQSKALANTFYLLSCQSLKSTEASILNLSIIQSLENIY